MEDYLKDLNTQQYNAVTYCDGPQLVIAGAGSGKTRVLTYKIVHLLKLGYSPYSILALTFTNKAAREMRERVENLLGKDAASRLWMGTFHSIFSRILRINAELIGFTHDFTIYDSNDSKSLIKNIIKEMRLDEKVYKPATIQSVISMAKNALISPTDYYMSRDLMDADYKAKRPATQAIYANYCQRCKVSNAMDFDDLLLYTNVLFRDFPDVRNKYKEHFKYMLVDEYQDTNFAQHNIILQIVNEENKLCVVGDDAQSIYSFRGANISNILSLNRTFRNLKIFRLERNYRSTQSIVNAANSLIEKNQNQIKKEVYSENEIGEPIELTRCYSEFEESAILAARVSRIHREERVPYDKMAILYRTNAQSRVLEECFRKYNIPYVIYGGLSFYQRKEIKDVLAYMRLAINPNDDEAVKRVINFPTRGIGDTTISKLTTAASQNNISLWQIITNLSQYEVGINKGTEKKISVFADLVNGFITKSHEVDAAEITVNIIRSTGLLSIYLSDNTPENVSKKENVEELVSAVRQFVDTNQEEGKDTSLTTFISETALYTDQDKETGEKDCITFMTVHSAKGLEFDKVFIAGVEDDLFPSVMSKTSLKEIEEERRLLYVAITRAKDFCMMTYAKSRMKNGLPQTTRLSPFVYDINPKYIFTSDGSGRKNAARGVTTPKTTSTTTVASRNEHPAADATTNDTFRKHNISELTVGMRIIHQRFGSGTITNLDSVSEQHRISVNFDNAGNKVLMLQFAQFKIC